MTYSHNYFYIYCHTVFVLFHLIQINSFLRIARGGGPGGGSTKKKEIYIYIWIENIPFFFARPPPKPTCWYRRYIYIYTLFKYINLIVQKIYHKHFFSGRKRERGLFIQFIFHPLLQLICLYCLNAKRKNPLEQFQPQKSSKSCTQKINIKISRIHCKYR